MITTRDALLRTFREHDGPMTLAQILAHPTIDGRQPSVIEPALRRTREEGLIREIGFRTYELTDEGAAVPLESIDR